MSRTDARTLTPLQLRLLQLLRDGGATHVVALMAQFPHSRNLSVAFALQDLREARYVTRSPDGVYRITRKAR